jgi:hypothetical protein
MMLYIVLPHWLSATKIVEHLEHDILVREVLSVPGVLDPVVGKGFLGIGSLAAGDISEPVVDPFLQVGEVRAHNHVVIVDDLLGDVAIGKHGVERHADLAHAFGDRIAFHAEMQVPIKIEIALEIGPHQRLAGVAVGQELVEELHHLVAVHRAIQVRRDSGHIDALPLVVRAPLLQPLQEDGDALLWRGLPRLAQQAPKIERKRVLLGELNADHRQVRLLAVVNAHQEMRDDDILHIGGIELAHELFAQARDGRLNVTRSEWPLGRSLQPGVVDILS